MRSISPSGTPHAISGMCYIHSTYHLRLTGWVGDARCDIAPHLFADADFAGDSKTSRSTSGVHLCLLGPNTVFPLAR